MFEEDDDANNDEEVRVIDEEALLPIPLSEVVRTTVLPLSCELVTLVPTKIAPNKKISKAPSM